MKIIPPPQLPSITVHLLHDNTLTEDNRDKFIQIAERYEQQLKFYNVEELCKDGIAKIEEYFLQAKNSHFSIAMFYRFFIPSLLLPQGIEKAIYLDSDIIVNLDIAELWQVELENYPLAAVREVDNGVDIARYSRLVSDGFVKAETYFNSGVLLMNLKVLRNEEANISAGIKFISEHPEYTYFDQEILNYCFESRTLNLPLKFNNLVKEMRLQEIFAINKEIYHYAANRVSLGMDTNDPYNQLFMDYFIKTPWVDADTKVALAGGLPARKYPAVSVVIPLYNEEGFIGECLDSLLAQTFKDFEVIVVDDCSTDNSVAIAESYLPKFNGRLKLAKTEKNMGTPGIPRNIGLKSARGEYVYFMDADDMILGHALETLYKAAILFDAEVVYTESYYRLNAPNDIYLYKDGTSRKMNNIQTDLTVDDPTTNLNRLLLEPGEGNLHAFWSKFVRRDFFLENKIFFPRLSNSEDFIGVINIYCHARRFLRISTPLYFYRMYNNSITRQIRAPQEQCRYWFSAFVDFAKALYELERENKVLAENPEYCLRALKGNLAWRLNRTEEARKELSNEEFFKILHDEFAKKFSYLSALLLPFLFSSINEKDANTSYYTKVVNKFERYLTARLDIKLMTTAGDFEILSVSDKRARVQKPGWLQKKGIGYQINSYAGELDFTARATVDGQIQLKLRGRDVREPEDKTKCIPYWIDYTKLTINDETIFDMLTPAWHDKPYNYSTRVKANDEITVKVEWLPHRSDT